MWVLPLIINQHPLRRGDSKYDEGLKTKVVHFKDNAASIIMVIKIVLGSQQHGSRSLKAYFWG